MYILLRGNLNQLKQVDKKMSRKYFRGYMDIVHR